MNKITKIYWNRVNLILETEDAVEADVYFVKGDEKTLLKAENNKITLNVTNVSCGDMIEDGEFFFEVNGEKLAVCDALISELDDFSRIFKYRKDFYALLVDFGIDSEKGLVVSVDYMMKNRKYKKNSRMAEGKGVFGKIKTFVKIVVPFFLNIVYKFLRLIKQKNKKTVLFYSENGNEPIGNLKFQYEFMQDFPDIVVRGNFFNLHGENSLMKMVRAVVDIAFSDVIVVDNYVSVVNILNLSKEQKIVQLWHAGVGFKAVGYARFGKDGGAHPFKSSHRKYDVAIVDDEKLIDIYKEVFGASEDIFKVYGMPRLQGYLSNERIAEVTEELYNENPLLKGKKTILFSPTYRGVTADDAYYDYNNINLDEIYSYCVRNDFCFVVKMHPFVKEKINIPHSYSDRIFDYSHRDINDLIYIADIMVTDYSSCAYEFSFFNRPLVFYRFDKLFYEYERPVHTLDAFSSKQYETTSFKDLMTVLECLKNISVNDRFKAFTQRQNDSCKLIADEILR